MAKGQEKPAKTNKPNISTKEKQATKKERAAITGLDLVEVASLQRETPDGSTIRGILMTLSVSTI